jgi:hypothetical protein
MIVCCLEGGAMQERVGELWESKWDDIVDRAMFFDRAMMLV